ncbi:MAG: PAS domain S-box protein [Cyclobacteriaceae bacterium]
MSEKEINNEYNYSEVENSENSSSLLDPSLHLKMLEVMDNATDLIQSCDNNGCFLFVNKCWLETLGYKESELLNLNVFDVIHPLSKDHCVDLIKNIEELRSVNNMEVSLISKNGRKVLTKANVNCQYDSDGNPKGTQAIFRDITEVSSVEQNARATEARYKFLVEAANDVIYHGDPYGNLLFINKLGLELTGYSMQELLGTHFGKMIADDYQKSVADFYADQMKNRVKSTYLEFPIVRKDGSRRWVGQTVRMLNENGDTSAITGFLGVVRDITEKRKIEEELVDSKRELETKVIERTQKLQEANEQLQNEIEGRKNIERYLHESKQEYERLFQNAHDAILIFRPEDEIVLEVNQRACKLYGLVREAFIGMSLKEISTEKHGRADLIEKTMSQEDYSHFEIDQIKPNGERIILDVNAMPVVYKGERAILSINRDVTKRYELNRKLEEERKQRITSLVHGQEIERKRFAKELHDGLGQMLTALVHNLRRIRRLGALNKEQDLVLSQSEVINQGIIEETRQISKNLMPTVLGDFGLVVALKSLADTAVGHSGHVSFQDHPGIPKVSSEAEIALYRIAQEALHNSMKYAEAEDIQIELMPEENGIVLTITDNGKGFEMGDAKPQGNGVSNMQERAEIIGAVFEIKSSVELGTTVKIKLRV